MPRRLAMWTPTAPRGMAAAPRCWVAHRRHAVSAFAPAVDRAVIRVLGSGLAVWRNVSLMSLTGVLLGDRQGMRQSCGPCHMRRRWHKKVARTRLFRYLLYLSIRVARRERGAAGADAGWDRGEPCDRCQGAEHRSHAGDGMASVVPWLTDASSPRPSGMARMAPASAGSSCAADSPAVTCWGVAPSARVSVHEYLASSAVAQVMKIALTAARAMSATVMTSSTLFTRSCYRLSSVERPLTCPALWAWMASTATIPVTVMAMLAAASTMRRGLRGGRPGARRARRARPRQEAGSRRGR